MDYNLPSRIKATIFTKFLIFLFCILVSFFTACTKYPEAEKIIYIGLSEDTIRTFDKCTISYCFRNKSKSIDLTPYKSSIQDPFKQWSDSSRYLEFVEVYPPAVADINFVFSDSSIFEGRISDINLLNPKTSVLSSLKKQDDIVTIFLRDDIHWKIADLQEVILFQIGKALGLPSSSNPNSVMSGRLNNSLTKLTQTDAEVLRALYQSPCDEWKMLIKTLPFTVATIAKPEIALATKTNGYLLLDQSEGSGRNAFWQYYPSKNEWQYKRDYPLKRDPTNTIYSRLGIVINDSVFIGDSYRPTTGFYPANTQGDFYLYDSTSNKGWESRKALPQVGYWAGRSFSLKDTGYVVLNKSNPIGTICYKFIPALKKWSNVNVYPYCYPDYCNFYELSNSFAFVLNQQAYLMSSVKDTKSRQFDPSIGWNLFGNIPDLSSNTDDLLNNKLSKTGFAVRNAGYGIIEVVDGTKRVWKYSFDEVLSVWKWKKSTKNFPGNGKITFSFVIGERAYVGTSSGEFWIYKP